MKKLMLFAAIIIAISACSKGDSGDWNDPVIPVSLESIEAVNIDNSGKLPLLAGVEIKKEAYMLGVKWITDNTPKEEDKFITGSITEGQFAYSSLSNKYSKAIKCNTQFNDKIPAGEYVSKFFKETDSGYLPAGIDEGYVLLVAPNPGKHSFTIEYYLGNQVKFSYDTPEINFF